MSEFPLPPSPHPLCSPTPPPFRAERAFAHQKKFSLSKCDRWLQIWQHVALSDQCKTTKGLLEGGCRELFMFDSAHPDPKAVVTKVWRMKL